VVCWHIRAVCYSVKNFKNGFVIGRRACLGDRDGVLDC
jgi:hypothetical protein